MSIVILVLVLNDGVPAAFAVGLVDLTGSNESGVLSFAGLILFFVCSGLLASSVHGVVLIEIFSVRLWSSISHVQADDDDTVIDVCWAVVCCSENTTLIITPAVIACSHSDGHGTVLDSLLHFRDIIHLLPVCSFGDNSLSILVSACIVFSLIRVIFL